MPYYSKEQIAQAREMDLLTYLQNYEPTELVHVTGNTYSTREHLCTVNFNAHLLR